MCDLARWAFRFKLLWRFTTGLHPQTQEAVTAEWNSIAPGWDSADVQATNRTTLAIIQEALQWHLALGPDAMRTMRVLDFGCGTGVLTHMLQPLCAHVVGVDVAPRMIDRLRWKVTAHGWPNVDACCASLAADDDRENAELTRLRAMAPFDLVVASTVFMFVPECGRVLAAIAGLLKPGGLILHVDWPSDSRNYRQGLNAKSATALYAAAGKNLEVVRLSHEAYFFCGIARVVS